MKDGCEAGCSRFDGGEVKHHPECQYYKDSLSRAYDELRAENTELKDWNKACKESASIASLEIHKLKAENKRYREIINNVIAESVRTPNICRAYINLHVVKALQENIFKRQADCHT